MRPVGYYAHHQGAGHWQRGCAVAARLRRPCTLIGTLDDEAAAAAPGPVLRLPDDRLRGTFDGTDGAADRPLAFHFAPLGHSGIRDRMAAIARWVADHDPALLVVDVSVEVALFARLLAVPTVVVRLAGSRTDTPHLEAYRSAERLLAPFPATLDAADTPSWVAEKTLYAGLVAPSAAGRSSGGSDDGSVAVVLGRGGGVASLADLAAAAASTPERTWHVLGEVGPAAFGSVPPNLVVHGWVPDPAERIARAAIVVGAAGDGVVGLAAATAKRLVCLPEPRPHDEQIVKARALARCEAAIVRETWPTDWPALLEEAAALDPAVIAGLVRPDGIGWIAGQIDELAESLDGRRSERPIVR